jgi:hypothetical protein
MQLPFSGTPLGGKFQLIPQAPAKMLPFLWNSPLPPENSVSTRLHFSPVQHL